MELKTPLYDAHVAHGGKIVPFAGYLLPVEYKDGGVIKEHMAVRTACGLFDVSHMGEIVLSGPGALASINHIMTNDFTNLKIGRIRYSPMCNTEGGVIDDTILYRMDEDVWLIVVNASNTDKDDAHIRANLLPDTKMENISSKVAQLALQGPNAGKILAKLTDPANIPEKYYSFTTHVDVDGIDCLVSQTGYTGEYGFEIYTPAENAVALFEKLIEAGKEEGLQLCGLGARDTLRLEAAMPLYSHEMDDTVSPLEACLDYGVKMNKEEFIGKEGIEKKGRNRTRIGLHVTGRGIIREHQTVYFNGEEIGHTTSGTHCAYLKGAYAMALVTSNKVNLGDSVEVDVRGRKVSAEVVALPFYKHS
ncbi:MAG: glycine cleavage system aminomethyltransferase GcvT [Erysipelotrichaceae bacterium]|nr:glycine cleavage system aminomethyltransferase GcvT [Erysipelotrichaceae bacterium]